MGIKEIAYLYTTDAWGLGAKKVIHDSVEKRNIFIKHLKTKILLKLN